MFLGNIDWKFMRVVFFSPFDFLLVLVYVLHKIQSWNRKTHAGCWLLTMLQRFALASFRKKYQIHFLDEVEATKICYERLVKRCLNVKYSSLDLRNILMIFTLISFETLNKSFLKQYFISKRPKSPNRFISTRNYGLMDIRELDTQANNDSGQKIWRRIWANDERKWVV